MAVALLTFIVFQTYVPPPAPAEYGVEPFRSMVAYIEDHLYAGNYYSAFPSEHCGYATILAIATWRAAGRGWAVFGVILGVAVILATQFLHQHYVMDAIYGVTLAIAAYGVAWWASEARTKPAPPSPGLAPPASA
jgi:membrane-associated phospholipid phosphatase